MELTQDQKKALKIFGITMLVLGAFLWLPIYIAGPDGLEQVMQDLSGDPEYAPSPEFSYTLAPFPDYEIPGIENTYLVSWLVGIIGSVITFAIAYGLFTMLQKNGAVSSSTKKEEEQTKS